jgi:hypothetical protein
MESIFWRGGKVPAERILNRIIPRHFALQQ